MEDLRIEQERYYSTNETLHEKKLYEFLKRLLDIIVSIMGIILAAPIIFITCILVIVESPGNPIFKQERAGRKSKEFNILKIRSMYLDAEKNGPQWADKEDSRVTKIGKFIRKTRIDELPQLFNVLKGDMSIVGPRPEREVFIREFEKTIPNFRQRVQIKPGLTGLAQVNGGYDISAKEKLMWDLIYIEKRSLYLDIIIILKTFSVIFTGEGAR
ncbi:sugar transferase [Clostridium tunisiense]|uniref:sugar transferase n=1 Tax=Clostridium tunisiense TaxID=219748 RepID=UPI0002FEBD39|nr:sugar transferase [Clostridium tunisiense]